jgi:hypothetical protein
MQSSYTKDEVTTKIMVAGAYSLTELLTHSYTSLGSSKLAHHCYLELSPERM